MATKPKRKRRICPFCGGNTVTFMQIKITIVGCRCQRELIWYCLRCGANTIKWTWEEDDNNVKQTWTYNL